MKRSGILLGIVALFLFTGYVLRGPVLEGRLLPGLRWYYHFFLPPDDTFAPAADLRIGPDMEGARYQFTARHRYAGPYRLVLQAEEIPAPVSSYDLGLRLELVCGRIGGTQFRRVLGAQLSPWWSTVSAEQGFELGRYDVPGDLPQGQAVPCELIVQSSSGEFASRYGATKFVMVKQHEK